jgi:hypothetical protein
MNMARRKVKPMSCQSLSGLEEPADDLERRRELGQFFTSPEIAGFIWDLLEVIHGGRFPGGARLIDPACGEGVFLRVAHQRGGLPAKNLFGTEIDVSLAPGWRGDPLMRNANLVLANGLLDAAQAGIVEGSFDIVVGNPPFSGTGLRDLLRLLEEPNASRHHEQDFFAGSDSKEETATRRQPLSAQERSELDRLARTLSRFACWRLDSSPEQNGQVEPETEPAPAELFAVAAIFDKARPTAGDYERAAHSISHWPPNRPLDTTPTEVREVICQLASTAIEVVFTERFVRLAKRGGLIAVIVPESIVASDRLAPFRIWLLGQMDLLASVSLPQKVFRGVGANAKTSIIFARRRLVDGPDGGDSPDTIDDSADEDRPIFLAAPRLDAPGFSLPSYLARVLADARRDREKYWFDAK